MATVFRTCRCGKSHTGVHLACRACRKSAARARDPIAYAKKLKEERQRYRRNRRNKRLPHDICMTPRRWLARTFHIRRQGAKKIGVVFDIQIEDLCTLWDRQLGKCALSQVLMDTTIKSPISASLDRKDSNLGYTADNIQLVCSWLNFAKGIYSDVEVVGLLHQAAVAMGFIKNGNAEA